ncbi:helix-turn-helix transcriptional regulator [uncultured Dysosmobacter sp.]|uniref:ArsR/SmtB family transcription factor n=1 Tax=uncultured Dysosmobacter sp. TaxID=2591384 RepID=UPI002633CD40|nr:metalloregulator ArsR/SmtB family transcription factor [uncultured Dysosmobacter sp.]
MEACAECVEMRTALAEEFRGLQGLFAALGDETRQRVFLALLESEQVGLRAKELAERTHLSRPAVSRHLRVLREAGAVRMHREGARNYYYPNADTEQWEKLRTLAEHICAVIRSAADTGYSRHS